MYVIDMISEKSKDMLSDIETIVLRFRMILPPGMFSLF